MRWVAVVVVTCARAASAEPSHVEPAPSVAAALERAITACEPALYLSPSLMLGAGSIDSAPWYVRMPSTAGAAIGHLSIGALIERCDGNVPSTQLRFGLTAHASNLHIAWDHDGDAGVGLEAEVARPIGNRWLGGRVAAETASTGTAMVTIGARFHVNDVVWLGVDGYVLVPHHFVDCTDDAVPGCTTHVYGVLAGVGLEAHPSGFVKDHAYAIGGTLLVVGGIITAIAVAAQSFHL